MSENKLLKIVAALKRDLVESDRLATAAEHWATFRFPRGLPKFTARHKELVTRYAFLQAFLAWEAFLDESFTLYVLGERAPKGKCPIREYTPNSRKDAERLITGDRKFADWTRMDTLKNRSRTFFRRNDPFELPLKASNSHLKDMGTVRNAIAHSSDYSRQEFQKLVRRLFGTYPRNLTVGRFLALPVPKISPPQTFLNHYFGTVITTAELIVPH